MLWWTWLRRPFLKQTQGKWCGCLGVGCGFTLSDARDAAIAGLLCMFIELCLAATDRTLDGAWVVYGAQRWVIRARIVCWS
jgi:hypothetical protein